MPTSSSTPTWSGSTRWTGARSGDLADRGYAAAEAMRDKLLPLAVDEATFEAFQAARLGRRRNITGSPAFITVTGVGPREEAYIRETLAPILGQPIDHAADRGAASSR